MKEEKEIRLLFPTYTSKITNESIFEKGNGLYERSKDNDPRGAHGDGVYR